MSDKNKLAAAMQDDAHRATIELNASLQGYTKEDVSKLYEKYGPYTYALFNAALYTPIAFTTQTTDALTQMQNYSQINPIKDLFEKDLSTEQVANIVGKPELEVITNINEYQAQLAAQKQIDATYKTICAGKEAKSTSIESLLAAGVTKEDFQAVFEKDETLAFNIGKSPSTNAIVDAAKNKNTGRASGFCGTGTQQVTDSIRGNPTSWALHSSTPQYALDAGIPPDGASGYYARLEQSGNYIVLTMPNEACVDTTNIPDAEKRAYIIKNKDSAENKMATERMCEFTDKLPRGTIITWDNHTVTDKKGNITPLGGGNGITYGHVVYKITDPASKNQAYKCDGVQNNPHSIGWYGKNIHMCYNIDAEVPAEYAKLLIEKAQERTGQCLNIEQNRKNYEATQTARQNEQIAKQKAKAVTNNNRFNHRVQTRKTYRKKTVRRTPVRRTPVRRPAGRSSR